jgi:hypothetical protein
MGKTIVIAASLSFFGAVLVSQATRMIEPRSAGPVEAQATTARR